MTIRERERLQTKIIFIKTYIRDYQEQGLQISIATFLKWLDDLEKLIKYEKK
jgi:hypothetical protein